MTLTPAGAVGRCRTFVWTRSGVAAAKRHEPSSRVVEFEEAHKAPNQIEYGFRSATREESARAIISVVSLDTWPP